MPGRRKSWAEKMHTKPPHVVMLEKPFAGASPGARLLISSPTELATYLREDVPSGTTQDVSTMRAALAARHRADVTCPLTTSIFLRIVAEDAWDALELGASPAEVAPFWRVIEPKSPLAKKLRAGEAWIVAQRAQERRAGG